MLVRKQFRFEASHILPKHPGKCSRLHGHSWVLFVSCEGTVNPETGFVRDYADISAAVKPLVEELDHHHLNDIVPYPSSELLLYYIGERLAGVVPWCKLALEETCTSYCELSRREFDETCLSST